MMSIKHFKIKIAATVAYILFLVLMWRLNIGCLWQAVFDIPCIGCGMTRACLSAIKLNFASAFAYHPMFWSLPILYFYILKDGLLFKNKFLNYSLLAVIAAGFIISYIYKLINI